MGSPKMTPIARAETATVYRGGGRRWFTLRAACRAEAKAKVRTRWEAAGVSFRSDDHDFDLERYMAIVERLARVYLKAARAPLPQQSAA